MKILGFISLVLLGITSYLISNNKTDGNALQKEIDELNTKKTTIEDLIKETSGLAPEKETTKLEDYLKSDKSVYLTELIKKKDSQLTKFYLLISIIITIIIQLVVVKMGWKYTTIGNSDRSYYSQSPQTLMRRIFSVTSLLNAIFATAYLVV